MAERIEFISHKILFSLGVTPQEDHVLLAVGADGAGGVAVPLTPDQAREVADVLRETADKVEAATAPDDGNSPTADLSGGEEIGDGSSS